MKPNPKDELEIEAKSETQRELADADWRELVPRLLKIAYFYAKRYNVSDDPSLVAQDAVQSAIVRTLDGRRRWNTENVDLFHFLASTIRSLISNEARKRKYASQRVTLEQIPSFSTDATASFEDASYLSSYVEFLRKEKPDLEPVLLELLSERHASQKDAAKHLGFSPSQLSKKRSELVSLAEKFKKLHVEINDVSADQTNS